ncbi:MAG: fluoride efflux transporter CrcB [Persicimonas sp.]
MTLWLKWALVAGGGALGAVFRTGISEWMAQRFGDGFAWGTLTVNLLGCLAIGAARAGVEIVDWASPEARILLFSGFLGAFTTFSTFEADTVSLWRSGEHVTAGLYLGVSVVGGLIAFFIGWLAVARTVG